MSRRNNKPPIGPLVSPTGQPALPPGKNPPRGFVDDPKIQEQMQKIIATRIESLGLDEAYQGILKNLFAPDYARKPVISPNDLGVDLFQNPMWTQYERDTTLHADRQKKCKDYADMNQDVLISTALDIYAQETCQYDEERGSTVWIESENDDIKQSLESMLNEIRYDEYVEGIAHDISQFGEDFVGPLYNRRDGIVNLRFLDPEDVEVLADKFGRVTGFKYKESRKELDPWDIVQFKSVGTKASVKRGGSLHGTSYIECVRRIWRQLRMLEDAVAIYRLDMGVRRFVFYVDVSGLEYSQVQTTLRQWERAYKKRNFFDASSQEFSSRHSPLGLDSVIFWPTRKDSRSRVDEIGGDPNISGIADLDYFRKKMSAALKIPLAYLGGDEYASTRSGLSQQDVQFARMVGRLQRSVKRGTIEICRIHLRLMQIDFAFDDFSIGMTKVSNVEQFQRMEVLQQAVDLADRLLQIGQSMQLPPEVWNSYILSEILELPDLDLKLVGYDTKLMKGKFIPPATKKMITAAVGKILKESPEYHSLRMDRLINRKPDSEPINERLLPSLPSKSRR